MAAPPPQSRPAVAGANEPGWAPTDPLIQALLSAAHLAVRCRRVSIRFSDGTQQNAFNLWQNGIDFKIDYRMPTEDYGDFTFSIERQPDPAGNAEERSVGRVCSIR